MTQPAPGTPGGTRLGHGGTSELLFISPFSVRCAAPASVGFAWSSQVAALTASMLQPRYRSNEGCVRRVGTVADSLRRTRGSPLFAPLQA